jgi:hypothetical protein
MRGRAGAAVHVAESNARAASYRHMDQVASHRQIAHVVYLALRLITYVRRLCGLRSSVYAPSLSLMNLPGAARTD